MEEQSSGELPSADPPTGAQDAGLQEPRISPMISLDPRSRLKHLQRPTSSDFSVDAPRLPCHADGHLACGGRLKGLTARSLFAFPVQQRDKARPTHLSWCSPDLMEPEYSRECDESFRHGRVRDDRVAQTGVGSVSIAVWTTAMTSPAWAPSMVKPRMCSPCASTRAFMKLRVSEVVRERRTATIGSFATRKAIPRR